MTRQTVANIKAAAWLVASALTSLGITVLAGTPWGAFCTHLATAIGFGLGITGPVTRATNILQSEDDK